MAANINTVVFWLMKCQLKWFELPWHRSSRLCETASIWHHIPENCTPLLFLVSVFRS